MSLLKSAGSSAIFFEPSYINGSSYTAGGIIASTMQALVHRIYQMDPTAIWQGSAGADDAQTETITCTLYAGVAQVQRVVDAILILNNNLNNFVLQYSTDGGSSWTNIATVTGNAGADYVLFLNSPLTLPAAAQLQLVMTTTFPDNQNKFVGNFIATLSIFQPGASSTPVRPQSKFKAKPKQNKKVVKLADGTEDITYFNWSDNSCVLNNLEFLFELLPVSDKAYFDSLFAAAQPFLCYPEPGEFPRNIYLCTFEEDSYDPDYESSWKGAGYRIPFRLQQQGYL